MTKIRQHVGQIGEKTAREHLEKLGYTIVETNYRCPLGEIDIIAREKGTVVIVEVRTRTGLAFGVPEESITADKSRRLHRLALHYLKSVYGRDIPCRIDMVAVMLDRATHAVVKICHIQNILAG